MKVDSKGVARAFKELPRKQRGYMFKAIRKSVNEGVRLAKTMAPKDTGDLAQGIHAKYEVESNALVGSVEAAASDAVSQIKALSVEFGRQYQPARTGNKFTGKTSYGVVGALLSVRHKKTPVRMSEAFLNATQCSGRRNWMRCRQHREVVLPLKII